MKQFLILIFLFTFFIEPAINVAYAQDATSNCVITNIGGGGNSNSLPAGCGIGSSTDLGNDLANYANEVAIAAQNKQNNCIAQTDAEGAYTVPSDLTGVIRYNVDTNCLQNALNNIFPKYGAAANDQVTASADSANDFYQCVGFIETVVTGVYGSPLASSDAAGFAGHDNNFGYKFISASAGTHIQPGDIAIWGNGSFGHIAIVLEAKNEGGVTPDLFRVAEANVCYDGWVNNNATPSACDTGSGSVLYGVWRLASSDVGLLGWLHKE